MCLRYHGLCSQIYQSFFFFYWIVLKLFLIWAQISPLYKGTGICITFNLLFASFSLNLLCLFHSFLDILTLEFTLQLVLRLDGTSQVRFSQRYCWATVSWDVTRWYQACCSVDLYSVPRSTHPTTRVAFQETWILNFCFLRPAYFCLIPQTEVLAPYTKSTINFHITTQLGGPPQD